MGHFLDHGRTTCSPESQLLLTGLLTPDSETGNEGLGVCSGDAITLQNALGSFAGRVKVDRIKPGCLQAHWPEVNAIIPAGRFDSSGMPDYNTVVDVITTK